MQYHKEVGINKPAILWLMSLQQLILTVLFVPKCQRMFSVTSYFIFKQTNFPQSMFIMFQQDTCQLYLLRWVLDQAFSCFIEIKKIYKTSKQIVFFNSCQPEIVKLIILVLFKVSKIAPKTLLCKPAHYCCIHQI